MNLIERIEYIFNRLVNLLNSKNSIYDLNETFTLLYAKIKVNNNITIEKIQILDRLTGRNIELEYILKRNKREYKISIPTNDKDRMVNPEMIITIVYLLLSKIEGNEIDNSIIERIPNLYKKLFNYD